MLTQKHIWIQLSQFRIHDLFFIIIEYVFAQQLGGGVICDLDVSHSECLKNAPTITFDFPPFVYHPFFFIIITIVIIIIVISVVIYFKIR